MLPFDLIDNANLRRDSTITTFVYVRVAKFYPN